MGPGLRSCSAAAAARGTRERWPLSAGRYARRPGVEGTEELRRRVPRGGCPRIQGEGWPAQGSEPRLGCVGKGMRLGPGARAGAGGRGRLQQAPKCEGRRGAEGWARLGLRCGAAAGVRDYCGRQAAGRVRVSAALRRGAQALRHGWARSVRRRRVATRGHLGLGHLRLFL